MTSWIVRRLVYCVTLITMASGAPSTGEAQQRVSQFDDPVAGVGDVVRITVWRRPEFSGEFTVSADSTIAHPLYQSLKIAGFPRSVATERLREFLATYEQNPEILLEVLFKVAVVGQVRSPSLYSLPPETTIGQAIAIAGGITDIGQLSKVELLRGGSQTMLNLSTQNMSVANMGIMSGDQLSVGRRSTFNAWRDLVAPLSSLTAAVASVILVSRN